MPAFADDVFDPKSKLKVEAADGAGGEGPAWHPKLGVLTSGNGHIYRLDRDGKSTVYRKDAGTNGLLFDHKGRLLACEPDAAPRHAHRARRQGHRADRQATTASASTSRTT